jgi:hypothetical protein
MPALLSGLVTIGLVLALGVATGDESGLPRQRIGSPAAADATSAVPATTAQQDLTLAADGLGSIDFGQPALTVVATLTTRVGPPDEDGVQPCENDATVTSRWVRWADLSIRLDADGFAAYIEGIHFPPGREALDFATARGLSPGDTAVRLHQLYRAAVRTRTEAGTAGRPAADIFTIAGRQGDDVLSAVVEHQDGAATVVAIFAGELC